MGEFSLDLLKKLVATLRRNQIEYIVVGGQAIAEKFPVYTLDLDILVAVRNFDQAVMRLSAEPMFGTPDRLKWIAKFEVHYGEWHSEVSEVDVLNGRPYAGRLSPDEFFDYVRNRWTWEGSLGPTAEPPVVWYTRLMAGEAWEVYARKIARDLRAGAPSGWLDGVREIAAATGSVEMIGSRVDYLDGLIGTRHSNRTIT